MVTKVTLEKSGMGIDEGEVARWLKAEGDAIVQGEIIAEVETAKSVLEIEAPVSGVLARIVVAEGGICPVNGDLAWIEEA
jgi:pyruvate/2-oxoglutarate dehydrogenase complex dihydrolipoamide acyltransferase (E2) component